MRTASGTLWPVHSKGARAGLSLLLLAVLAQASATAGEVVTAPLHVVARTYDTTKLLGGVAASADLQAGRALWLQRCAYCHDGVGQPTYRTMGPWLGAETVQALGPVAFNAIVAAGTARMPGFRYALGSQQLGQLLEFLKTVGPDQKPTPEQLARKSSGAAAGVGGE